MVMPGAIAATPALRVCADPDNLPFSHADGSGFENQLAAMLARDLGMPLRYTWLLDRRGFVRKTMGAGLCDVIMGLPASHPGVATTAPYYRSAFYFVQRPGDVPLQGFTDARLRRMRVGIQLIGIDPGTSPAGYALARHAPGARVTGYTPSGANGAPARQLVDEVAAGSLDTAILWGPQAGYFASQRGLVLSPAGAPPDMASVPFEFPMAIGVRPELPGLRDRIDLWLRTHRDAIDAVLERYHLARVPDVAAASSGAQP